MWGRDFQPDEHDSILKAAEEVAYLPTVDVFLPVCNENIALLNNTWEHVKAMDYPSFAVFVLDDGAKDDVRDLAAAHGFQCKRGGGSTSLICFVHFSRNHNTRSFQSRGPTTPLV